MPALGTPAGRALLLNSQRPYTYLLGPFRFSVDASAPLPSPYSESGAVGSLTLVQNDGQFSASGGKLVLAAQSTPVWGDQQLAGAGLTRTAGRALIATQNNGATSNFLGWASSATPGNPSSIAAHSLPMAGSSGLLHRSTSEGTNTIGSAANSTDYQLMLVLRTTGCFYFVKGGIYTDWTLLWVANTDTTATLYPTFGNFDSIGTLDNLRVLDLGPLDSRFATDFGLATNRLVSPAALAATTHTADCLLDFTVTTVPSGGNILVNFRRVDASNYWQVWVPSSGQLNLTEVVGGVRTDRAVVSAGLTNGTRVVVVADGTTIKGYSGNTLRFTYSSASNFATATAVEVNSLGTGGVLAELVAWPRTISLLGV